MASLLNSESRRLYSWWWDSHISPKNSKWLQENLKDMDVKVKAMIKLIEEDADSFARRAEMYYKKRPELMKLVEEFYRAYRALAERYDHATGELRHAQKTMSAAFPNQAPFELSEDSASSTSEPHTPEMPHPFRALLDSDELHKELRGLSVSRNGSFSGDSESGISLKGLKQLQEMFGALAEGKVTKGPSQEIDEKEESLQNNFKELSNENKNLKAKVLSESERASKAETEVQTLKKSLGDINGEKEAIYLQYLQSLQKLSCLEGELSSALKNSTRLREQANKAEAEVHTLKEALAVLEAEKDGVFSKQTQYLEKIANLEGLISHAQEEVKGVGNRAFEAESETQYLRNKVSRLESEKEVGLVQYKQCLNKISDMESKISAAKEDAKMLHERAAASELEVEKLKRALSELNEEKEVLSLLHERCLDKISKLESDLSSAQEEVKRLNGEILVGATKLKRAEEVSVRLEMSNKCLRKEADNLAKKIALKDQELSHKHDELEKLQTCVHDEHSRYVQVEASLKSLQCLHSQSQEEQRVLAMELKDVLELLKDLEACKHGLEEETQKVKDENRSLNELNSSSTASMSTLENEIIRLKNMKRKLEEEVELQLGQSNVLQQEICSLKEEIKGLNSSYQTLMKQVEGVGLDPESFGSSVKDLQDENLILRQNGEKDRDEKVALSIKLESLKLVLEKNGELEGSKEKVKELQDSCQLLNGENSTLVLEKALLLSQLRIITENMQKLLEKNNALESSLTGANVELEGLRTKSKSLEDLCQLLKTEKSNLVTERSNLVVQLETVEDGLANLEKRFSEVEEKYAGLEMEKESTHSQVQELKVLLIAEKQEREKFSLWNDSRLADVENHIRILQEDGKRRKKEFQDELDKAVIAQFDVFVLQKFIEDMEERNYSLMVECEKHIEASKLADKLISELESENLEQQVEEELLLVEIEKLRLGIYQVFKALDFGANSGCEYQNENEEIFVHDIVENIENMKSSLLKYEDERQQLLVENSVILTMLEKLKSNGQEIELEKNDLHRLYEITKEQLVAVQNEKCEIVELNRELRSDVRDRDERTDILKREVDSLCAKQSDLERAFLELQEEYSRALEENRSLSKNFNDLKKVKCLVEEENDLILLEALSLDNIAVMYKSFDTEKAAKLKSLNEDTQELHEVKNGHEKDIIVLKEKLAMVEAENVDLKSSFERLEKVLFEVKDCNDRLKREMISEKGLLDQKEIELFEAEEKIKQMETMNSDLCIAMEGLKWECEESITEQDNLEKKNLELREDNANQRKEIECLHEVKGKLESELDMVYEEIEEQRIREDVLSSELQERENEFELWEAEATTFYFDLQISNIREVIFEDKVHELTGVCKNLEDETASKNIEIEQMKERVCLMESEMGGLKGQLNAYTPVIASLKETIASLEDNSLTLVKLVVAERQKSKDADVAIHLDRTNNPEPIENVDSPIPDGISDLEKLQTRIIAVEKVVLDELNTFQKQKSSSNEEHIEAGMIEIEELNSKFNPHQENGRILIDDEILVKDHLRSIKTKPELSDARKGILMKDIQLDQVSDGSISGRIKKGKIRVDDQMLELWQSAEDDRRLCHNISKSRRHQYTPKVHDIEKIAGPSSVVQIVKEFDIDNNITIFNQAGAKRARILQRLTSDAQKLANLQTSVQDMMKKLEMNKKIKKMKGVDLETVKEQLKEVEESTVQLVKLNGQLIEKSQTQSLSCGDEEALGIQTNEVSEEARKGSEKIGRLQLEVQKIHYMLVKLDDEKKGKGESRFSRTKSKTSVILKDFIYSGKRGSGGRRKKGCLRGCFRPSSPANGETSFTSRT